MNLHRAAYFVWSFLLLPIDVSATETFYPQRPVQQKTPQATPGNNPLTVPMPAQQKPQAGVLRGQVRPIQQTDGQLGAVIEFSWRMQERFGLDENRNGIVDIRNTRAYAFNVAEGTPIPGEPDFVVELDAGKGGVGYSPLLRGQGVAYAWRISGKSDKGTTVSKEFTGSGPRATFRVPEGNYTVDLRVTGAGIKGGSSQQIRVEDIVIVALGDSYSSGEGNPESSETVLINSLEHLKRIGLAGHPSISKYYTGEPAKALSGQLGIVHRTVRWADDGLPEVPGQAEPGTRHIYFWGRTHSDYFQLHAARSAVGEDHIKAHRSSKSWPAMAALAIERADPHSSVTFIHLAASGATIAAGVLGPYYGTKGEKTAVRKLMEPQVHKMRDLLAGRAIDLVTISVGGNDAGFANAVASLIALNTPGLGPRASTHPFSYGDIQSGFTQGKWKQAQSDLELFGLFGFPGVEFSNAIGLEKLQDEYAILAASLRGMGVSNVWMATYPNPLWRLNHNGQAEFCDRILNIHTRIAPSIALVLFVPGAFAAIPASIDVYIDRNEIEWAQNKLLQPLNSTIMSSAARHGWVTNNLPSVVSQSNGHGMCASRPQNYPTPNTDYDYEPHSWKPLSASVEGLYGDAPRGMRWFRTQHESLRIQGGKDTKETVGTLHPNEFGHWAMAERLLNTAPLPVPIRIPGIREPFMGISN